MRTIEEVKTKYDGWMERHPFAKDWDNIEGDIWVMLDHIATLEAQNAALQARVDALGEWRDTKTFPRVEHSIPSAVHTETVEALIIVRMYHTLIREGKIESYWQDDINRVENGRVLGWRYIPDESPTAEE